MSPISGVSDCSCTQRSAGAQQNPLLHQLDRPLFQQAFAAALQDVGVDPSKVDALQQQIQSAIQDARNQAGSTDPRRAVQDALNSVLQQNGIDPAKFHHALRSELRQLRAHDASNTHSGTDADGDNDGDVSDASSPDGATSTTRGLNLVA